MHRKKEIWPWLLLAVACMATLGIGITGLAQAAYPASAGALQPSTRDQVPVINDPYHHLSGVLLFPPSRMKASASSVELPQSPPNAQHWAGPLTPPVFGPNVDASLNNGSDQNETTASINPDNDQVVIASANDYRCNLCPEVYRSTDGGTNWVNYAVPGVGSLFYGDPAMAFDHNNYAYFSYLGYGGTLCSGMGGMYVSNSTDGGATMSPPVQLAANSTGGSTAILQDKEYITADTNPASPYSGTLYVAWTRYTFLIGANCGSASSQVSAPVVLSRSTDRGLSWTQPITASDVLSDNNSFTSPVVGPSGELYLYYLGAATQQQTNYDSVLFSRSTDGGQTFPFFTHIASLTDIPNPLPHTNFRDNAGGSMAADRQLDGYLYAVWADYGTGDADILLSRSTDDGTTWGTPVRLNDDPIGNGKDQFFPWIASAPDGYIHVGWFDRRDDPLDQNYKEYYTYSSDHGATWAPNVAVSSAPSVPGGSGFIGDYSGIAASTGVVMPVWTDIRTGANQNAYVARGIYTATTPTATSTATATDTPSDTPTNTATSTSTPTATDTATETSISTSTSTAIPTPTACTIAFTDVPPGSTFYPYIHCLACLGLINGYPDGTFRPNNNVTRGQLSKIVANSAGFNDTPTGQQFQDVPPSGPGSTFYVYIFRLASRGYINGYPCGGPNEPCIPPDNLPYFRPNANATRGQISKIVSNAAGFSDPPSGQQFQDVPVGSTYYTYTYRLVTRGVMSGYPCGAPPAGPCVPPDNLPYFRPNNNATRGQTSKIVANTFFPDCNIPTR